MCFGILIGTSASHLFPVSFEPDTSAHLTNGLLNAISDSFIQRESKPREVSYRSPSSSFQPLPAAPLAGSVHLQPLSFRDTRANLSLLHPSLLSPPLPCWCSVLVPQQGKTRQLESTSLTLFYVGIHRAATEHRFPPEPVSPR